MHKYSLKLLRHLQVFIDINTVGLFCLSDLAFRSYPNIAPTIFWWKSAKKNPLKLSTRSWSVLFQQVAVFPCGRATWGLAL